MFRLAHRCLFVLLAAALPARAQDAPTYPKDIQPLLAKYCVDGHRTGKSKGGTNLESLEASMRGTNKGRKLVVPGQPDQSRLVTTTEWKVKPYMPPRRDPQPTDKERELLRTWVKAGAKKDAAEAE